MHRVRLDHVIVIQDQPHLTVAWLAGQLVDDAADQTLEGRWRRRAEQWGDPFGEPGPRPVQRCGHVPPQPGRVVVARVQGQPRCRVAAAPGPVGQQDRLPEASGPADQHHPAGQPLVQQVQQPRTGDEARLRPGHVELGGQQAIRSIDARVQVACRRLSHHILPNSSPGPQNTTPGSPGPGYRRAGNLAGRMATAAGATTSGHQPAAPRAQDSTQRATFG
jgi:hypothetical protein